MMTRLLTPKSMPVLAALLSGGLLIGAWIFQYGFGYAPCQMCYWQRHAHKLVLGLAALGMLIGYFIKRDIRHAPDIRLVNGLLMLALLGSAALAMWHMGVEYKWWEGPKTCLAEKIDLNAIGNGKELLASLEKPVKPPACTEAAWRFLGLSMAGWNMLASFSGALGILIFGFKKPKP